MEATLLVELLTEELPPKSLLRLAEAFRDGLAADLERDGFVAGVGPARAYATPRRLAVQIPGVRSKAPDTALEIQGPSVKAGRDKAGKPTAALAGFARKHGVDVAALVEVETPKGAVYACRKTAVGSTLAEALARKVEAALRKLPVARMMRWGEGDAEFVRPVHGLVMLHGEDIVPGTVLGLDSGNRTRGHRFMSQGEIVLANADAYETQLRDEGSVIADFAARRAAIEELLRSEAQRQGGQLGEYGNLLDEVTALVEFPAVYPGEFERAFLAVPPECLILTMQQNQKYFPLFDAAGGLTARFLIVSNMRIDDPAHIIDGNERVVRPRLADARFFYDQDRKRRLETRVPELAKVVYHNKLGSQLERVERLQLLAGSLARTIGADPLLAERAAWLAKADLVTGMVGEFPELQGIMGGYYALQDGEAPAVVEAIRGQYRLRLDAADAERPVSMALYLAERIELLIGMFGIGNAPTGEKDPFALRRGALGVISVYEVLAGRGGDAPDVREALAQAVGLFRPGLIEAGTADAVHAFVLERYRHALAAEYAKDAVDAVLSQRPRLAEVVSRVEAVERFRRLPEAESLAAANKRIRNILQKSPPATNHVFSETLLRDPAEQQLYSAFRQVDAQAVESLARREFGSALSALSALRASVDAFFDGVMVNVEDAPLRNNRLMLLAALDGALNRVADISRLAR